MATSRRKDPADYLDGKSLLEILTVLAKVNYFDITVHTPDDFRLIEDYFAIEMDMNPEFLTNFTRIIECTLLLDTVEYQNIVYSLSNNKEFARTTRQYMHTIESRTSELTIINLFRDVRRTVKKKVVKKAIKLNPTATKEVKVPKAKSPSTEELSLSKAKEIQRLEKRMKQAVEAEDYEVAVNLRNQIRDLKDN